ncbi:cholinesterase, partial [Aureobasidium melanogenum]
METVTTPQYELFLLWTFPHQLFISLGNGTFKCSVGFFLIRVGTKRWGRWVLYGLMLFITISSLVYGSTLFWSCIPLRANWHFDEQKNAKMISNKVWMGLAMWNSVANMLTDSILAFFPMPIVLRMKVSTSKKVALVVALSLGWLTVVCGAVKTWVMWNYFTANDKYYKDLYFVWCFMEMSVGSIAASVPLLQPLVNKIRRSSSSKNDSGKVVLMPLPGAMPATPPQVKMRRPIITWTGMGFTSFQDGEEIKYDDPERSGSSTRFANIPYLAGNVDYEAGFYKLAAWATNKTLEPAQWDDFNLAGFTCPTGTETANRAKYNVPTWRYRYFGDWENLRLYPGSRAYHGTEITMIFRTAEDVSGLPNSAVGNGVSMYMMKAWPTFTCNPARGLEEMGWPTYEPRKSTLAKLAYENMTTFVDPAVYDVKCPVVDAPSPALGAF